MNKITLDQNQLAAIDKATASGLTVITGGAGTGKTLIALASALEQEKDFD